MFKRSSPKNRIATAAVFLTLPFLVACATSPLNLAIKRKDFVEVQRLVEAGADINKKDGINDGSAPLPLAVSEGTPQIAAYLVKKGAGYHTLAVYFASALDSPAMYDALFDNGVQVPANLFANARIQNALMRRAARASSASTPAATGLSSSDIDARIAKAVQAASSAAPETSPAAFPSSPAPHFTVSERSHDLAVIVGIESYSDISSKASYAERDADAFKAYVRALGVPERNIILIKGSKAVRSALTKNIEGWLPRMAKADSRVYFYFSGHGAPDVKTGQAYLVPWDGDPNFLDSTAYPVAQLYKKLGELPAKQVLVAMDSCFSGAGGRSVLASGARPLVAKIETGAVPPALTVLAASGFSEISGSLDDKGHGAFTYFLLEGLNAGRTTPKALAEYLTPRVQDEARRLNRDQTPQLQGDGAWSLR